MIGDFPIRVSGMDELQHLAFSFTQGLDNPVHRWNRPVSLFFNYRTIKGSDQLSDIPGRNAVRQDRMLGYTGG